MIRATGVLPDVPVDLEGVARTYDEAARQVARRVVICAGTGCMAGGALKVFHAFEEKIKATGLAVVTELRPESQPEGKDKVFVSKSGCQGFCQMGPLVTIEPDGILYTKVQADDVEELIQTTLVNHEVVERLLYVDPMCGSKCKGPSEIPFYRRQYRSVLAACGRIDPEDIREYIARDGYRAAERAYREMTPAAVCEEILHSGLRGRGGGGFPTGRKWELTRKQPRPEEIYRLQRR